MKSATDEGGENKNRSLMKSATVTDDGRCYCKANLQAEMLLYKKLSPHFSWPTPVQQEINDTTSRPSAPLWRTPSSKNKLKYRCYRIISSEFRPAKTSVSKPR